MNKFRNKGVSFIELVIAVVIFGILITPIVSQLIQAMKTSEKSKVAQTKYELAENLMENAKNAGSYFFTDDVTKDSYLNQISEGAAGSKVTKYPTSGMEKMTTTGGHNYEGCVLTGETLIGKKKTPYYYAMHITSKAYAEKEETDPTYTNPNNMTLATIESLDESKVALIDGTIGNYDLTVTNAFMSKKLDILKVGDHARWEQYTKQQAAIVAFPNDTVTRVIEVSVKDENVGGVTKYTVTCRLRYKENSTVILKDGIYAGKSLSSYLTPIEYVPYERTFENALPNIYLMYNPCLYNSNYMDTDYVLVNTSELSSDTDVNLFLVETAERYSNATVDGLIEVYKENYKKEHGSAPSDDEVAAVKSKYEQQHLINQSTIRDRSNVNINLMAINDDKVKVYHNFDEQEVAGKVNKKNTIKDNINKTPSGSVDAVMTAGYTFIEESKILPLSSAVSSASALYDVDIYISDTAFTSTSYADFVTELAGKKAIISGSKGGN